MGVHRWFVFWFFYTPILITISISAYTLTPSQSISDGQTLISIGGTFELGFFSPSSTSSNRFLGIWYNTLPVHTVVWVANRDAPLNDTSGVFRISPTGDINIISGVDTIVWSANTSKAVQLQSPVLEFLQSGNLVLVVRDAAEKRLVWHWQSFDYPGNTLLPGMKLGLNLKTGVSLNLWSWKSVEDPSYGNFTYGIDTSAYLETVIRRGSEKYYRGGPWNGLRFSGSPDMKPNPLFTYQFVHDTHEVYYMYQPANQSVVMRTVLMQTGTSATLQLLRWTEKTNNWVILLSIPRDRCDDYAVCGAYSTCDATNVALCQCLKGFNPKSPQDWVETDWSGGCQREILVNCSQGEGFRKYSGLRLPDTTGSWVNNSMSLEECRVHCFRNCSCMAYSISDITDGGRGCLMWFTDLLDIRQLSNAGQDIYVRMAASDLESKANPRMKTLMVLVGIASVGALILLGLVSWWFWKKRTSKGGSQDDLDLPLYDLITISNATNNFSKENKLGEGGFGPVHKGRLEGGQDIAVKRLSKDSIQGVDEFKNEVVMISKLQHRNLVKLLGCCIQGEEMMLVYEYMQNNSLDTIIFDATKSVLLLDWQKRYDIILGIARGLAYLHHDSRLRIIHRDLKASNVLVDTQMVPKISDFGMARIFVGDQCEGRTKRVVGTYGYMAPEYAIDGHFSIKSDVFSFGVLVLEIISGKKNRSFGHPEHGLNLLGHTWRLWSESRSIELVDEPMRSSCAVKDLLRCVHIGLLCVQKRKEDRPTMSTVVLMLSSESLVLPTPQKPGYYVERSTPRGEEPFYTEQEPWNSTEVTITMLDAR